MHSGGDPGYSRIDLDSRIPDGDRPCWAELYGGHGCAAGYGSQSRYSGDSEDSQATERKAAHKESAGGRRTEKVALQRRAGRRRERCVTDITD